MNKWIREHGLLLANAGLFIVFFGGMVVTGAADYSDSQTAHGHPAVGILAYLGTGAFLEATFANWESEFLQMGMYVILTVFLFQKGSSESKPMGEKFPQDQDPRQVRSAVKAPWPVRRGGWVLRLYEHSLSIMFLVLFLASVALHAVGGSNEYNQEQQNHGQATVSVFGYLATSRFWFESFQNWQSEFLAVAVLVGASVYLREKGSPESKPVAEAHYETGA
jgi:hypothetical protein